eukprot:COSAG01_NODE_12731_length_1693_cov_1.268507_2_plen_255_part_00
MRHLVTWTVLIKTTDEPGAGSNAAFFVKLIGETGVSENITPESGRNDFERGETNEFKIQTKDIGRLTKIRIGHDGQGIGAGWHMDSAEIIDDGTRELWKFPCHRWFDEDQDDGIIVRELAPIPWLKYHVNIITGDVRGAATDAAVTIVLYGARDPITGLVRDSGERVLDAGKDNFERNKQDLFIVECQDLGGVEKVRIGHDGTGLSAGWFLGAVEVWEEGKEDQKLTLKCERWLDKSEDDGAIVRVLTKDSFND